MKPLPTQDCIFRGKRLSPGAPLCYKCLQLSKDFVPIVKIIWGNAKGRIAECKVCEYVMTEGVYQGYVPYQLDNQQSLGDLE